MISLNFMVVQINHEKKNTKANLNSCFESYIKIPFHIIKWELVSISFHEHFITFQQPTFFLSSNWKPQFLTIENNTQLGRLLSLPPHLPNKPQIIPTMVSH